MAGPDESIPHRREIDPALAVGVAIAMSSVLIGFELANGVRRSVVQGTRELGARVVSFTSELQRAVGGRDER